LSSAGKKTAQFLLAGASDSYFPYLRCVVWRPRLSARGLLVDFDP